MIIDDLPSISIANDSDEIAIEQGTATKKITKGNFLQEVTSAISSLLSSLSGKVSKAGDTMTGVLYEKTGVITIGNVPASHLYPSAVVAKDSADVSYGGLYGTYLSTNQLGINIGTNRKIGNSQVYNWLGLLVDANGSQVVTVSNQQAWRTALGLEAVEFNLTRASGVSAGSGYGIYDPGSKTVRINGWAKSDTDIATGTTIFTVPAEYRPSSVKYGSTIIITSSATIVAYTIGLNASGNVYQSYTNTTRQIMFNIEYKI